MSHLPSASDHQIRAADPGLSVFVTANAGSGKTSTLVNRVARLLLHDVAPGEILCITYTKAAAAEMQARLFETLGLWAVMDDRDLPGALSRLDGRDPASFTEADLTAARSMFARALETPGGLKIQTIHAFCEKLLRRFPIEADVSPRFTVLENEAALTLSRQARDDLAREAIRNPEGPIGRAYSYFAVALDWKAFQSLLGMIETQRESLTDYLDRVASGMAPGPHALAGALPGRSASELETEFMAFLDREVWDETATAMMAGSANDQGCAGRMREASWTFGGIGDVFLTKGSPRKSMATKGADRDAAAWLEDLQMKYCATLSSVRAARVAEDTERLLTLASVHAAFYEAAKAARGALDFPDLVTRAVRLLTQNGAAAWVLYKLDGGIEHVLIDEAQDTAPDQWSIVHALTDAFFSGEGGPRPGTVPRIPRTVFAVGDEKQSIYSFQGARPERLRQEAQRFTSLVEGAELAFQHVPLDTSYRSTEEVLGFVDAVFHSPERTRALVGETGDRIQHHPARVGQHGSIELWPLFEDEKAPERDGWLDPVDLESSTSGRKRLAVALALEIRRQVETGVAVHARGDDGQPTLRPCGYDDFLILVRRRDGTFEEIIRALKTLGVPVAGADRLKLSTHIVFDDLIALARFALFPDDDLSLAGVLRSPFCDVPDFDGIDSLYALAGREKRDGLWRELRRRGDEQPAWNRARALMQFAIDSRDRDPFAFFAGVLNRVDDAGQSGRARILARLGREAEEAIDETLAQVLSAEDRGATDLETCVAMLESADVEVKREMDGARAEVRVMTVHGAKGLEAPIVILPDTTSRSKPQGPSLMPVALDDGSEGWLMCPGDKSDDCDTSAETRQARIDRTDAESLRLLYVALTRARDRVIILGRALGNRKEGFEEGSWWDSLAETFARLQANDGTAVRDVGDGRLRFGVDPVVALRTAAAAPERVEIPAWTRTTPASDPAARFVSPSQMQGGIRMPAPSPLAVVGEGLGRFRRGDLIHRLLERLPDIDAADRQDAARRILAREPDLSPEQRAEMIEAAFGVLDDDRFAPVFGPGSRAEVALTGSAPSLPPGVSVSGRIDRLVLTPERVLIVDYKTNRPAPQRIEDADLAYVLQQAVYRAVLQQLYPDRAVEAALVWTDGPRLMAIPAEMMDAALSGAR
ncbi:double-strand break repair helicase AddA [Brevundimonas variabilis]|uniref:DNA 3'-5' helicase n=1 Tax=Brevundimonas variabilis TaxID=74312 RepID=A0A7W9CJA2_9CAUL|nr:double-strand break repair helicase AddA [Brevundimonas variabilis]MBB5746730.1 ATP-dependent helicase/nuclease subunit A [Brevundimonas variabilis]